MVAPVLKSAFPPVLFPEEGARVERGGTASGFIDLFQAFPARRGEGSGEYGETVFGGVAGCLCQAQGEALQATAAAFRFVLQALHGVQPVCIIVVCIDEIDVFGGYETDSLVFPYLIFRLRIDVGIAVEYGGAYAVLQHALDDGRGARCAARMQQHLVFTVGCLNFQHYTFSLILPFTSRPVSPTMTSENMRDLSSPGTPLPNASG